MRRKMAALITVFLAVVLVLSGCVSKAELEECQIRVADLEAQNSKLENQVNEQATLITELEPLKEQNASLEEQNDELASQNADILAEIENLRDYIYKPPLEEVSGEIAGYIGFQPTVEVIKKFFPEADYHVAGSSQGGHPLNTVETLKQFIRTDSTNKYPPCQPMSYDAGDGWAFQLKTHWIDAGLSAWSLGIEKVEAGTQYGRMLVWRNVFLTEENGAFVFYEVNPCTGEIIKIEDEGQTEKYQIVTISSRLWLND